MTQEADRPISHEPPAEQPTEQQPEQRTRGNGKVPPTPWPDCHTSISLAGTTFAPPEEFVSGFLTIGLTTIAASPKVGKTWLCHEFALAIADGTNALGVLQCKRADVLCLFLEDSLQRLTRRERALLGSERGREGITYVPAGTNWTVKRFREYLDAHPTCRCAVIDTAERFRQMQSITATSRIYADDYAFWGGLQHLAMVRNIALVLVHHDRKAGAWGGDVTLDSVSGTRAVTGSADHIWLLSRNNETGVSKLTVIGRDLEERSIEFQRDGAGRFAAIGEGIVVNTGRNAAKQQARCLRDAGQSLRQIAADLRVAPSTIKLWLEEDGQ